MRSRYKYIILSFLVLGLLVSFTVSAEASRYQDMWEEIAAENEAKLEADFPPLPAYKTAIAYANLGRIKEGMDILDRLEEEYEREKIEETMENHMEVLGYE